ncbi:RagB/SusD family nutrient uptake outer membrane protein [Flavivirga aquimarina]|uniref:RagB/SusD family nutrient uptake outer membrane protein n=1 Tax=Flavivirga aquimarina TaxID=2027862 RepID=A0ABT8WBE1_9FLAO|nr:RagB/SusD family nutrient uptake outer membrane protein [Flavivirga aquimarina]MDO5970347.1 RagB/SusD family nutrient uptake outer membrane protein [Flavivirga aquimarina]
MKKYIVLIGIITMSFFSCSEESLSLDSPNDVTVEGLLTTTTGFKQLLTGAYDAYQKIPTNEYLLTEVRSDNATVGAQFGSLATYDNFNIVVNDVEVFNYWSNNYKVVYQTNLVLDNQDTFLALSGADETVLGEAYFLRALAHFNLVRVFRDIPYIDQVITVDNFEEFPQLDEAETYQKINADFESAISFLEGAEISNTRANEGTATIFLAKSILSQPSPDYVRAQSLLLPLIEDTNEFGFTLTQNFDDIFARGDDGDENNEEIILKVAYTQSSGNPVTSDSETEDQVQSEAERWSFDMTENGQSNGANLATADLETLMTSALEPVRFPTTIIEDTFFDDRTFNNKWVPDNGEGSGNDWVVLRYADVLLLYCEAVIGDTQSTDSENAIVAYNKVRARAGLDTLDPTTESLSRDALLAERRMEFVFENQRFYDLIRFGVAINVLQAHSDEVGLFFSPSDIYIDIPQREVDNSDGFYN